MTDSDPLIILGIITSPHGVRGQVKIHSYTEQPEDLTAYGPLYDKAGNIYELHITGSSKGQLIASVKGIENREQAAGLRSVELGVPRSCLPEVIDDNEFLIEDLVGLPVTLEDGHQYGIVKALHNFGAGDIVEIEVPNGKSEMVLFTADAFPEVSTERLLYRPPEVVNIPPENALRSKNDKTS